MKTIFLFSMFLTNYALANCQIVPNADSIIISEKAKYLNGDLTNFLTNKTKYPTKALENGIQGDVVMSFVINKNGKMDSITISNSPNITLTMSANDAFNAISKDWSPAKVGNAPIDKRYLLIFRYRIYIDTQPSDYKGKAKKYLEKKKYEKALNLYNIAITDNPFDYELFALRSKTKEFLGDIEGARMDQLTSMNLKEKIITIVEISTIGITRHSSSNH